MNKRTIALSAEQYKEIIQTMKQGFSGCRPNERIAAALMLEANLGLRISDIVRLRLSDIVKDGERYRLSIIEQKQVKPAYLPFRLPCTSSYGFTAWTTTFPQTHRYSRSLHGKSKSICKSSVTTSAIPESAHIHSESSTQQKSTQRTATISFLFKSCYSIAAPQSHKHISESSKGN